MWTFGYSKLPLPIPWMETQTIKPVILYGMFILMRISLRTPSLYEGFGNAFLEAIYFKKPILINRYPIFVTDIEQKGFDLITMDGFITEEIVRQIKEILVSPDRRGKMVKRNYDIASRNYSYIELRKYLSTLITSFFGAE